MNIKLFKYFKMFSNPFLLGPIITLVYLSKGLDFIEIFSIYSISTLFVFIFEVPTGAVADRFGYRISLLLGSFAKTISIVILFFASGFFKLAVAEIIFSLGMALTSGADTGLLYDSLIKNGEESDYKRLLGEATQFGFLITGVGSVISSIVYAVNPELPLILSMLFLFVSFVLAFYFEEISFEHEKLSYFGQIKTAFGYVVSHKKIRAVILSAISFYMVFRPILPLYQPTFEAADIPVAYYGLLFFVFNIVAAYSARKIDYFSRVTKGYSLIALNGLMVVSFLLLGLVRIPLFVGAILLQQIARGVYSPIYTKYINKHTPSHIRATTLSFYSLATNLAAALFALVMGVFKDHLSIYDTYLSLAGVMLFISIGVYWYLNKALEGGR